jgi:hypothetical protein
MDKKTNYGMLYLFITSDCVRTRLNRLQQLLVAPAALALLVPPAVANAANLNLTGVNRYASSDEQVTSISQFADVKPTDWAYQALSNLIERYGCVAGYPNGTFKGGQAITRFEAAALLNACLDRVTETTDQLKKLLNEFQKELAILKGRVDGLDARVGVLEARQFSTTTKLSGVASMVIGGVTNGAVAAAEGQEPGNGNHIAFNYNVNLNLDTSFSGKDLLRTTLRANNFQRSVFAEDGTASLEDAGEPTNVGADAVGISRLFYQFPLGDAFKATVGAKVRQDDMLAMWPSVYEGDSILARMHTAGASGTYSMNLGSGVGISYQKKGFSLSALYISNQLSSGNSSTVANTATETSVSGFGSGATTTAQVGYAAKNWGMAFAYNYTQAAESVALIDPNAGYESSGANNLGFSAYWEPEKTGFIPSVSAGVGSTYYNGGGRTSTWMVGLVWSDAFRKGNALGMAYGDTQTPGTDPGTYAYELYYKFQMSDNISVTPAFFWIDGTGSNPSSTGGLLKTTFRF